MVIWLIGMSGAGKSSIADEVYRLLKERRPNVVMLDGDGVREVMGNDLGHSLEDRKHNADRLCRMGRFLDKQGIDVVCAILSIFPESRDWNREHIPHYFETYIRVSFDELVRRDSKGLYKKALAGEITDVVGVDIEFPEPTNPDLVIENDAPVTSFTEIANRILDAIPWENQ